MTDRNELRDRLAEPFDNVQWRLQQTHPKGLKPKYPPGTRGMFLAYIDARQLYERLDDVFGFGGWQRIVKQVNADGSVIVELRVKVGDEWISHEDIGYSNNPGEDHEKEPLKAAVSDGAKRCGVGIGIGRFLYELEPVWMEVDEWGKPAANQNTGEMPERKRGTTVNTVPKYEGAVNGVMQPTREVSSANTVDAWSAFWAQIKTWDLPCDKKALEKHIGTSIGINPELALEKVQAWRHDNAQQPALAS